MAYRVLATTVDKYGSELILTKEDDLYYISVSGDKCFYRKCFDRIELTAEQVVELGKVLCAAKRF